MVLPSATQPVPYRFGWFEIIFGTLAVMALAAMLALLLLFAGSLLMVVFSGIGNSQAWLETLPERGTQPRSEEMQTLNYLIGIALYAAVAFAVVIIARNPLRMPLAARVAFADWTLDRQYWTLLAACLAYALVSGYWVEWVLPESRTWNVSPTAPVPLFLAFVLIVGVGPFCEELLLRGWIFSALRTRLTFMPTLLITSVVFALMHFEKTLLYALVVFPIGLALGFVRERYGSIKASASFHGMYNLFAFIVTFFDIA